MTRFDRFPWIRRDGAPFAISLVLHLLALLLLAPWLVMRTIPNPRVEVEVMIETVPAGQPRSRPEKAAILRAPVKVQRPPAALPKPLPKPVAAPPVRLAQPEARPQPAPPPATQPGEGKSGRSILEPSRLLARSGSGSKPIPPAREAAGLSAPAGPVARSAAVQLSAGPTALQPGSAEASPVAPRAPSLGSTPQPSARSAAAAARPGDDRQDGPLNLAGPVPQAQSAQPEFRQGSRLGGPASLRGGSQAPDDGVARQAGAPDQAALLAARAVPQVQPGSGLVQGGVAPALAAPVPRSGGAGSAAAAERSSPGLNQAVVPVAGAADAAVASHTPSPSGQGSSPAGAGAASGVRTISPSERGSGLMAAAASGEPGSGAVDRGTGPGASVAGEGRTQTLAGGGGGAREAASALRAAEAAAAAARAGADSSAAQLSGAAETPAQPQPLREARAAPLQTQQPSGQARVIEERFTATALKVDSPRSICSLPLMFAGFDRRPIPEGLDSINATAARLQDETPPRHHPANQAPRYPIQALGMRAEGRVLVRAEILPNGTIGKRWIKQSSGLQVLDLAALETVNNWRFFPAQRHGMAVAVWLDVPIEYKLP